ncbi:MAG: Ig-like domain-containing protein [Chloroflexota bacterium]
MRAWTRFGAAAPRANRRASRFAGIVVIGLVLCSALPADAADGEPAARAAATGAARVAGDGGHSAVAGSARVVDLRQIASPPRGSNLLVPRDEVGMQDPNLVVRRVTPAPATPPRAPKAPTTTATIPTTTTLEVTPPNPVIFPALVHVKATVAPPPQASGGFTPAVGFYIDGQFNQPAPLSGSGIGEADVTLGPGTYQLSAQFGGLGDYGASASPPVGVDVVQKPDLATVQGAAQLQSSAGFEWERHTSLTVATSPSIGVGPHDVVAMNEGGMLFMDRVGTRLFHLSLPQFFFYEPQGQANDAPRGGRIMFDELHDRWIATEVTHDAFQGNGHVYIAVSLTDEATGDWWIYRFDFANQAPRNPSIGVSSNKVAIGYDVATINTSTELGSTLLIVDTDELFAPVSTINFYRTGLDPAIHSWRPAVDRTASPDILAVGWTSATNPGRPMAIDLTGTVASGISSSTLDLTDHAGLPDLGSGTSAGPTDAVSADNHLWFVSTRACLPDGDVFETTCVRVTELDTSAMTVLQDFVINRTNYGDFMPGIAIRGDGSVVVVYSEAAAGPSGGPVPVSTWATVQVPGDAPNTIRPPQLIAQGQATCEGGPECFGANTGSLTHVQVSPDPTDTHAAWQASVITVTGGWAVEAMRLSRATTAPDGDFTLDGGRSVTNSLRVGIAPTPAGAATATQLLISDSPTTTSGVLANAKAVPIDLRIAWSLADPAFGGTTGTGPRSVYVQWGDGRGNWSSVEHHEINVDAPLGADFVQLAPARLLDTRNGNGLTGALASRVPKNFQVTGRGGVPGNAVAVTGNLTVTGQTTAGYAFLGPTASADPTSSTLNVPFADTRANGVTVKLGPGGKLGVVFVGRNAAAKAHLIFDVTGYLVTDTPNSPVGGTYVPINPARALDTRVPTGLSGKFHSKLPRTFCITGCLPVPDDAIAVSGNLTVTRQSSAGYMFLGPSAGSQPSSSTLNFPIKDNRANNVTVGLNADGNLAAVFVGASNAATTDVIFDVTGYFVPGPWGAAFVPVDPTRILDSRTGTGLTGPFVSQVPRPFPVAGQAGVPATGTVAITGNVTLTGQTTAGYAFVGPTAGATPTSSTINVPLGDTRANGLDIGLAPDGTASAVWVGTNPASTTQVIFDVQGYFR